MVGMCILAETKQENMKKIDEHNASILLPIDRYNNLIEIEQKVYKNRTRFWVRHHSGNKQMFDFFSIERDEALNIASVEVFEINEENKLLREKVSQLIKEKSKNWYQKLL